MEDNYINKSVLIERLSKRHPLYSEKDIDAAVRVILEIMGTALSHGKRIEIRGFGSFVLAYRSPYVGRNPRTGKSVEVAAKYIPHFKVGKDLRVRVTQACPATNFHP